MNKKLESKLRKYALYSALNTFLSDYPTNLPPGRVLNMILNNSPSILVWWPFEGADEEWLVEQIESTAMARFHDYQDIIKLYEST